MVSSGQCGILYKVVSRCLKMGRGLYHSFSKYPWLLATLWPLSYPLETDEEGADKVPALRTLTRHVLAKSR